MTNPKTEEIEDEEELNIAMPVPATLLRQYVEARNNGLDDLGREMMEVDIVDPKTQQPTGEKHSIRMVEALAASLDHVACELEAQERILTAMNDFFRGETKDQLALVRLGTALRAWATSKGLPTEPTSTIIKPN